MSLENDRIRFNEDIDKLLEKNDNLERYEVSNIVTLINDALSTQKNSIIDRLRSLIESGPTTDTILCFAHRPHNPIEPRPGSGTKKFWEEIATF